MTEPSGGFALNAHSGSPQPARPLARGRGARSNTSGRHEDRQYDPFDDGWTEEDEAPQRRTTVLKDASRSIISTNSSPDISFDQSINPYRGCEHGCVYCYARPSHAYWGYSPGLDFETILFAKPNASELLGQAFNRPSYRPRPIVIGANTDAWQPVEREREITRNLLKVFARYQHPVSFITKSALILRDIDILAPLAAKGLAKGAISITTLDRRLARDMEPRAAAPHRRLAALKALSEAGIPMTVMTAPIIPALNDHEMEAILEAGQKAGARSAGYVLLRLPLEIKDLFKEWLADTRPDAAAHVMSIMRQMRNGREYDASWGQRGRGSGPFAQLLAKRFRTATRRLKLTAPRLALDCNQFRRPLGGDGQPSLFDTDL